MNSGHPKIHQDLSEFLLRRIYTCKGFASMTVLVDEKHQKLRSNRLQTMINMVCQYMLVIPKGKSPILMEQNITLFLFKNQPNKNEPIWNTSITALAAAKTNFEDPTWAQTLSSSMDGTSHTALRPWPTVTKRSLPRVPTQHPSVKRLVEKIEHVAFSILLVYICFFKSVLGVLGTSKIKVQAYFIDGLVITRNWAWMICGDSCPKWNGQTKQNKTPQDPAKMTIFPYVSMFHFPKKSFPRRKKMKKKNLVAKRRVS